MVCVCVCTCATSKRVLCVCGDGVCEKVFCVCVCVASLCTVVCHVHVGRVSGYASPSILSFLSLSMSLS